MMARPTIERWDNTLRRTHTSSRLAVRWDLWFGPLSEQTKEALIGRGMDEAVAEGLEIYLGDVNRGNILLGHSSIGQQ